jgi:hypothetical protein
MRHRLIPITLSLAALAACAPAIPDSGAGFDVYDEGRRAAVDAELEGRTDPATGRDTSQASGSPDVAEMAAAALDRESSAGDSSVDASPLNRPPQVVTSATGISSENDFDAVSDQRSIEQDAALIAQNRSQYEVMRPTSVSDRPSDSGVSIVAFALRTDHAVGEPRYSRSSLASKSREARNCRAYASADLAQEAFLAAGGPEKDREGLDADGDGYACAWNPAPYRRARG